MYHSNFDTAPGYIFANKRRMKREQRRNVLLRGGKGEKILFGFVFVLFAIYALSLIYPFFYLIINSLQDKNAYINNLIAGNPFAFPKTLKFSNYLTAFSGMVMVDSFNRSIYLPEMFFNSVWYVAIVVGGGVLMSSFTGYCLAKYRFKLRGVLYAIAIFTMTIPVVGTTGASFKLMNDLRIYNSPLYVILTSLSGFGFNFLIMYGFFKNISWSYAEAVFMDGGGHFTVFFKIMLPQARPLILTLAIVSVIGAWNDYMTVLLFMPDYPTIAAGIYRIQLSFTRTGDMPAYFAGLLLSILPIVLLFSCFSDVIMKNFTMGGIKG